MRIRSASWLFASSTVGLLISFPMSVLLARALGPAGKGTLSVVQQVAIMGAVVLNFGLGQALTYRAARKEAAGEDAVKLSALLSVGVATALLAAALVGGRWFSAEVLHTANVTLVLIGAVTVAPVLLGQLLGAFVIGSGSVRDASLVNVFSLAFQFVTYLVLFILGRLTATAAIVVWVVAVAGVSATYVWLAMRVTAEEVQRGARALLQRSWRYGLISWASGGLGYAALRQDVFLLAYFKGPAAVGVYSVGVTLAELCWYIPSALNGVLMPKVAAEREQALELTLKLIRLIWPVVFGVAAIIWLLAVPLVPVVFGPEFSGAVAPFVALVPGIVAIAISSLTAAYLQGLGHPADWTVAAGLNVVVNVVANIVLIPRFGAVGAGMASSLSYTAAAVTIVSFFVRRTGASVRQMIVPRRSDFVELGGATLRALRREG